MRGRLLAELPGIDHLRVLSAKAGRVGKLLTCSLDILQRDVLTLTEKRDRAAVVAREILQLGKSLGAERAAHDTEAANGAKLLQERVTLAPKEAANAGTEARLRELSQRESKLDQRAASLTHDEQAAAGRVTTPRRDLDLQVAGDRVPVIAMAPEDVRESEAFMWIRWSKRKLVVPLTQPVPLASDEMTQQAIADWQYWQDRGEHF